MMEGHALTLDSPALTDASGVGDRIVRIVSERGEQVTSTEPAALTSTRERISTTETGQPSRKALFIFAHPDDAEQFTGGTAWQLRQQGIDTVFVEMTSGKLGTSREDDEIEIKREQEARDAAVILQIRNRINLGFHDALLQQDMETLLSLVDVIREQQPDIIFTHARNDYHHQDHSNTAQLMPLAVRLAGFANLKTNFPPINKRIDVFFSDTQYATDREGQYEKMGIFVALTPEARRQKAAAFLAHRSQQLEEPRYGGMLTHKEMTKRMEELRGMQVRVDAAEAFTQLIDDDHPVYPADEHPLVQILPGKVHIIPSDSNVLY